MIPPFLIQQNIEPATSAQKTLSLGDRPGSFTVPVNGIVHLLRHEDLCGTNRAFAPFPAAGLQFNI
ncbi:MAG: hypothetical protein CO090_04025 [Acidobacteria bacterium CG_4_9_14_3_um_filter_49_7]|nr:MAG: hypothetical protein CO090_04025 [Acidobacteria bacterium CG_4_9_14_3_um_filter_49_7]